MPPVLIPIFTAAGVTGTILGVSTASILAYAVFTAAMFGLSYLLKSQIKPDKQDPAQVLVKQSLPTRMRGYGRHKVAGAMFFLETSGGTLYQGLVHCEGPIDAIEQFWLNDVNTGIASGLGGNNTAEPWYEYVKIESHLGETDQTASAKLLSAFSGIWTANHRLRGLAYSVVSYHLPPKPEKNLQKVFPSGAPGLRVVARLSKVYDPRTGLTAWSDNAALAIRDYLTHRSGFGLSASRIDDASFILFASICDEAIPLLAGGYESRYRIGGMYQFTEERKDVLRRLLVACDAELSLTSHGKVQIRGGVWQEPTVTITDAHILAYEVEQGSDKLAAFNRLKISYTSPLHDYQATEGLPWDDLESQAELGVLEQDLSLPMVPSYGQARRLAKIAMAKGNPRWKGSITTTLAGLEALGERTITVQIEDLGLNETFLITHFEIAGDLSSCSIGIASLSYDAYEWVPEVDEGTAPPVPSATYVPLVAPTPSSIVVGVDPTLVDNNIVAQSVEATATAPADPVTFNLIGRIRFIGGTDDDWRDMTPDETDAARCTFGPVQIGETYQVQVAYASRLGGAQSAWSATQTINITEISLRVTEAGLIRATENGAYRITE